MAHPPPAVFGALPYRVKEAVAGRPVRQGGVHGETGLCWLAQDASLLIWKLDRGQQAHVTTLSLPEDASSGLLVELVPQASGRVTILAVVTGSHTLLVWPDAAQPFQSFREILQGYRPTALTASVLTAEDSAEGIVAVVGFQDGSLQRIETSNGISTLWSNMLDMTDSRKRRQGVLTLLGAALKTAYTETFSATVHRHVPCSGERVVAVAILPPSGATFGQRDILVLTADSLEQWKLLPRSGPEDHSERCEVSLTLGPVLQLTRLGVRLAGPQAMALPQGSKTHLAVLSLASRPGSSASPGAGEYVVMHFRLAPGLPPSLCQASLLPGCPAEAYEGIPSAPGGGHQLVLSSPAGGGAEALLLMRQPNGLVWIVGEGSRQSPVEASLVRSDGGTLGCCLSADGTAWLILDEAQGVLAVRLVASAAPSASARSAAAHRNTPLSDEARRQVYAELDDGLSQLAAGRHPKALGYTLEKLGAFACTGHENAVASYSCALINRLPKHWTAVEEAPAGLEAPPSSSTAQQLEYKLQQHNSLIDMLEAGDCLRCLHPTALRIVFENAEVCSALFAIRQLDNRLPHRLHPEQASTLFAYGEKCSWAELGKGIAGDSEGLAAAASSASVTVDRVNIFLTFRGEQPLHEAVAAAGERIQQSSSLFSQRDSWEVFYARPSLAVPLLFDSFQDVLSSGLRVTHQKACLAAVRQLLEAAEVALLHATDTREDLQRRFPRAAGQARGAGEPVAPWTAGADIRSGLQVLVDCCLERRPPVKQQRAVEQVAEVKGLLFSVGEKLLAAFAEAEAALAMHSSSGDPAGLRTLKEEYTTAKHEVLGALFEEAKWEAESKGVPYLDVALMRKVERLSEHHCSYPQLFDISELLGDCRRLHRHMETCGPPAEMTRYVIGRLYDEGRHAELLELPRQFDNTVLEFLTVYNYSDLLWKHEVRMRRYSEAGGTLERLASAHGGAPAPATLQDKRRLLSLEHLCHLATASPGLASVMPTEEMTAANNSYSELVLVDIQQLIGCGLKAPMSKAELVAAALEAGEESTEAYAWAMTVFAVAGREFMAEHEEQMKHSWLKTALATNWDEVLAARSTMTDEQWAANLCTTPLVQAIQQAYFQYGLEAQIPAQNMKDWLMSEPALSEATRQAALLAVDYALRHPGSPASGPAANVGVSAMEM
mmetsp:Transcript_2576/g.7294  ORF Transcript_2576/g.7294 Transcript_2576/m.7294 type:complete len:1171 (+) Transcript_2576:206-3718(+)